MTASPPNQEQAPQASPIRLGDLLTGAGLLKPEDLRQAMVIAKNQALPVGRVLIMSGFIVEPHLQAAVQAQSMLKDGLIDLETALGSLRIISQENVQLDQALSKMGWSQAPAQTANKLGDLLVDSGIIDNNQLETALLQVSTNHLPLGRVLVINRMITEQLLASALNAQILVRDRDLDEEGNCPNHKKPPKEVAEENYFFKLNKYKPALREWLEKNPDAVQPDGRRKEVLNQLNDPELGDFSVSRSKKSLTWGIGVPDDDNQVIYVWVDALTNYITGCGYLHDDEMFKTYWPADLHLIGKDINKFHSIYWTAFLMAAGLPLPEKIFAHGFITVEGQKISKSLGNVIDPNKLVEEFGADALRFYLFSGTPMDQDGDFSRKEFIETCNAALANGIGNLLSRTLKLIENNCGGLLPEANPENTLRENANELHVVIEEHMAKLEYSKAISAILALSDLANKYMNDEKPWQLFKEGKQKEGEEALYTSVELLRRIAFHIYPFCPKLASDIWWQLGHDDEIEIIGDGQADGFFDMIPAGQKIRNAGPIFKRLEEVKV